MAFTVTATESGSSASHGVALLVRVLTNAVETGGASGGNDSTGGATAQGSLTPAATGSYVAFSVSGDNVTAMPAAAASNTYDFTNGNPADLWSTAQGHYTGTVTAGTPLTYGAGSAGAQDHSNWCAYEIPASGGTITVDGSSPAGALSGSGLQSGTAATTASFTPPVGSVLVAQVCAGGTGTGTGITITMSDTSGLGLVWTRRAISLTTDNFQPTFIFTTTVGSATPTVPSLLRPQWERPWTHALSRAFGPVMPFSHPPAPSVPIITSASVALSGSGTLSASIPRYIAGLGGSGYNSYFTDQFGQPKLMLLEQAWALPWNAGRWSGSGGGATPAADYASYFAARSAQGYTSWFGIAWGNSHVDSTALSGGRTWDGVYPLNINGTPGAIVTGSETVTLNNSFWSRIDTFFATAAQYGVNCFLNLSMSYDISDTGGIWQHASNTQGGAFGAALAARYPQSSYPHVFWFFGDDDDGPNDSFYQAILTGIQGAGDTRSLISIEQFTNTNCHIEFDNGTAFSGSFGAPNATYNWVYSYDPPYLGVEDSYTEGGTFTHIPPVYGDGVYYGDDSGQSSTAQQQAIRHFTWWALASGARGIPCTSGPSDLGGGGLWTWQSGAVGRLTSDPNGTFTTSTIGSIVSYFSGLADWHKLIPDTGNVFITAGRGTRGTSSAPGGVFNLSPSNTYVAGSITPLGTLAVIYCRGPMSITIDQSKMSAGYTATWVDPLSLATTSAATGSTYSSSGLGNNSAGDPDWVLVLQGPPVVTGTVALSGAGTLTGAPVLTGSAVLSGTGSLTASPAVSGGGTASLSGLGTLTASPVLAGSVSLSGLGTLTAAVTAGVSASLSGTGTLSAAPRLTGSASLSGSGTLTAGPVLAGAAALSGAGTLSAVPQAPAGANLSGAGTLSAAPVLTGAVVLTGAGTLTLAPALAGAGSLSGLGTLTGSPQVSGGGTASLSGLGTLTAAWTLRHLAALSGVGTLTAAGGVTFAASATLSGIGVLAVAPAFQVARSASSVTVRDTSTASVTDPRDGAAAVTALATSSPGVS